MNKVLLETESICPECLKRIPAQQVRQGMDIYLQKSCPEHGEFVTVIWRGEPDFESWVRPKMASYPARPFTPILDGCPYDCGLCSEHRQHTCSVLLEVTQRCDLHCPVCFADSGGGIESDWTLAEIEAWYKRLLQSGGPFNIQLSGGEPCKRDDLPEIIRLGRSLGFEFFQLNTNGLRLARDPGYLAELKEAGLSTIFLQFDGTEDAVYKKLRGRPLLAQKLEAIWHCKELGIGVVLVPTLVPGVNINHIGDILYMALAHMPVVRGVHFQPISYFGRYPEAPADSARITIPEVIHQIEFQTEGLIRMESFCPPGCENARCSFHANFVLMPDGDLKAITRHSQKSCCKPSLAAEGAARAREFVSKNWTSQPQISETAQQYGPSLGGWEVFLERKRTHTFCVSGMAFQDAWNLDLERLRDCCIHVASPDGRLVPFCAYNLTDRQGRSLYRHLPAVKKTAG